MRRRTFMTAGIGAGLGLAGAAVLGRSLLQTAQSAAPGTMARGELLADGQRLFTGADLAFGTTLSVQVAHADEKLATIAIEEALDAAKKIDRLMSLHRADSQVMQLNTHGVLQQPDPHLLQVIGFSQHLARQTGGAFDITVQSLWQLFTAAAARGTLPDRDAHSAAMAATGWQRLRIERDRIALDPGMAITLNGVAQGYAVDLARQALAARGITNALLDTGEFGARGEKTPGAKWAVGVRDPRNADAMVDVVPMDSRCVATSGDYETYFTPDYLHHHIFDPATGDSPTQLASVTVIAPTGLQADGWSTAFMVMGMEQAIAQAATMPEVDLMLVDKAGAVWRSAGFPRVPG
jgi:thiamine biosynthesis lipoprotein